MSGRFFKAVSDSESESSDTESDIIPTRPQPQASVAYVFSDEEEEIKRTVRSEKDKRYEELHGIIKLIRNCRKILDISKMLNSFENLTKAFHKARHVVAKEEKGVIPKFYLKILAELESFVNEFWEDKEKRKNLSKINSKSFGTFRQKLRKYIKEFEAELHDYKSNPLSSDDESKEVGLDKTSNDEFESSGSDDFVKVKLSHIEDKERVKNKQEAGETDDNDFDDIEWALSVNSDDTSDEDDDDEKYEGNLADKFLKKDVGEQKESKKKEKRVKCKKEGIRKRFDDEDRREESEWEHLKAIPLVAKKQKIFAKDEEINHANVVKKLVEILAARGKKKIARSSQIELLFELLSIVETHRLGPSMEVKILLKIISALFEYNPNNYFSMKPETWDTCLELCKRLIDTLWEHLEISVSENIAEETESFVPPQPRINGCVLTLVERMDEEFTKILHSTDCHSMEYIERLKDETTICHIIQKLQKYLEINEKGTSAELCRIYLLRIDHLYYKFDAKVFENDRNQNKDEENGETVVRVGDQSKTSIEVMDKLCKYIYAKDEIGRIRTQAILCHIYHHALHDNWFEAKDLMLMSQLQHSIHKADIPFQVIYNRALVQLGLCAFRHGYIKDSHQYLLDIQIQGRARELLAQGLLQKQQERTPEQERIEKRRLLPFHKHINLDLLECVHLVSAMLLEIPDLASNEFSVRKKIISRVFFNQLRKNEEQPLIGVPETVREHIFAASKAMRIGNWKATEDYIINKNMNTKVWNLFHQSDKVRKMLIKKIREESLRAFLYTYSHIYDCISLQTICDMFDLDSQTVESIISKMIINQELMGSLDEPTKLLIMHRTEPSRIQSLSLQLADKINILIDHNEKIWKMEQLEIYALHQQMARMYPHLVKKQKNSHFVN